MYFTFLSMYMYTFRKNTNTILKYKPYLQHINNIRKKFVYPYTYVHMYICMCTYKCLPQGLNHCMCTVANCGVP